MYRFAATSLGVIAKSTFYNIQLQANVLPARQLKNYRVYVVFYGLALLVSFIMAFVSDIRNHNILTIILKKRLDKRYLGKQSGD